MGAHRGGPPRLQAVRDAPGAGVVDALALAALPSMISGVGVALMALVSKRLTRMVRETREDWAILKESQRNQLKNQIVVRAQEAEGRGWITPYDLESVMRMADSYYGLGGNSYIHAVVKRLDAVPVKEAGDND